MNGYAYVVNSISQRVLYCAGSSEGAVIHALEYVIRRHALQGYLTMRQGLAPNVYEPVGIFERGGRKLAIGDLIDKPNAGRWITPDGSYKRGRSGSGAVKIASPLPDAQFKARDALARRYPKTWGRYLRYVP